MRAMQQKSVVQHNKEDESFIHDVLKFHKKSGRHTLIWRKKITAYRILVSEIMLQQTQVSRVIPKFETWMKHYPTLQVLSEGLLKEVLTLWQGLGYQRRAKALLQIAKSVKRIPATFDALLDLPGIGTYTASAVCAFAFNNFSHPVLETNIRTALIEYFHQGETEIHDGMLYDDLTRLEKYPEVQKAGARIWYYALMDYGAYLKENNISHNKKSVHYRAQSPYKGSLRELRAKTLFAITHNKKVPKDERLPFVIKQLINEGYVVVKNNKYFLQEII